MRCEWCVMSDVSDVTDVTWVNSYLTELLLDRTATWLDCCLTELLLYWTFILLNCYLTELLLYWTVTLLSCYFTERLLYWTVTWPSCYFTEFFAFLNLRSSEVSNLNLLWLYNFEALRSPRMVLQGCLNVLAASTVRPQTKPSIWSLIWQDSKVKRLVYLIYSWSLIWQDFIVFHFSSLPQELLW